MTDSSTSLRKLAKNRRFDELEAALLPAIESRELDRDSLTSVLTLALQRADGDVAERVVWVALSAWTETSGPDEGLALAEPLAQMLPRSRQLREQVADLYRARDREHGAVEEIVAGVLGASELPLPAAMERIEKALSLPPGTYVLLRSHKAPGRVSGFDPERVALLVDTGTDVEPVSLADVGRMSLLDARDYRALAAFEPDEFADLASNRPGDLIVAVLKTHGPRLSYRDLRSHIKDVVPGGWSKWWNAVRPIVRRSPWIDLGTGSQPTTELRRTPLSHEDQIEAELDEAPTLLDRVEIAARYLDESGELAASEPEVLGMLMGELQVLAEEDSPAVALSATALLDEMRSAFPDILGEEESGMPSGISPAEALAKIADSRLQSSVLRFVEKGDPEGWPAFFGQVMPVLAADVLETADRHLVRAGKEHLLFDVSKTIMANPRRYPGALVWLWKAVGAARLPAAEGGPDRAQLVCHLISAADRASRQKRGGSELYSLLQNALSQRNWASLRQVLGELDLDGARQVRDVLDRSMGIRDHLRSRVADFLAEAHPSVFASDVPPWAQEDVIYTTAEGLARKREEYAQLVNERLPEIADAIGRAAAFGDLSENAEYSAALEERARMTERANALGAELERAEAIPIDLASGEIVTVGTAVKARSLITGKQRHFAFLGPWDVDVENGVYSYRAPLSRAFMGKKVGDKVSITVDGGDEGFEILEVGSAL